MLRIRQLIETHLHRGRMIRNVPLHLVFERPDLDRAAAFRLPNPIDAPPPSCRSAGMS